MWPCADKSTVCDGAEPEVRRITVIGKQQEQKPLGQARSECVPTTPIKAENPSHTLATQPPKWLKQKGLRRVMAEFRAISEALQEKPGSLGALRSLSLPDDDDLNVWRMEFSGFDTDVPAGMQLNSDLEMLVDITGGGHGAHIIMEAIFPDNYPAAPFFLRVVSPRMVMYTGHVTAGGSICIEALTSSGSPGAWKPEFTVEGILNMVVQNMLHTEMVEIQTAHGPGGKTGPLRVNLGRPFEYGGPAAEYSMDAAAAAFQRSMQHHSKHGW